MPTAAQLTGKGFLVQWLYGVQTLLQIIMVCDTRNQLLNLGSQTPTRCVSQVKMMKTLWGDHICSLDLAGPWWNGCTFVRQHALCCICNTTKAEAARQTVALSITASNYSTTVSALDLFGCLTHSCVVSYACLSHVEPGMSKP